MTRYEQQLGFQIGDLVLFAEVDGYSEVYNEVRINEPMMHWEHRGIIHSVNQYKTRRKGTNKIEKCYSVMVGTHFWNISESLLIKVK